MQGFNPCSFLFYFRTSPHLLPQLLARSSKEILLHDLRLMLEAGLGKVWEDFIIPKHTDTGGSPHMGYNIARTIPHSHHNLPCRRRPRAAPAMFLYHILGYDFLLYSCRQIINYNSFWFLLCFFCTQKKREGNVTLFFAVIPMCNTRNPLFYKGYSHMLPCYTFWGNFFLIQEIILWILFLKYFYYLL